MGRAHYNGTDSKGEGNYNVYRAWKLSGIIGRCYHTVCWNLHGTLQSHYMDYWMKRKTMIVIITT